MLYELLFDVTTVAKILEFIFVNIAIHIAGKGELLAEDSAAHGDQPPEATTPRTTLRLGSTAHPPNSLKEASLQ